MDPGLGSYIQHFQFCPSAMEHVPSRTYHHLITKILEMAQLKSYLVDGFLTSLQTMQALSYAASPAMLTQICLNIWDNKDSIFTFLNCFVNLKEVYITIHTGGTGGITSTLLLTSH
jgi:hypothetical protein